MSASERVYLLMPQPSGLLEALNPLMLTCGDLLRVAYCLVWALAFHERSNVPNSTPRTLLGALTPHWL